MTPADQLELKKETTQEFWPQLTNISFFLCPGGERSREQLQNLIADATTKHPKLPKDERKGGGLKF
jgi:hypothetical protein